MIIWIYAKKGRVSLDPPRSGRKYEVDFILAGRTGIVPMEVKSGRSTPHSSLDKLMDKYGDRIERAFVIHSKDFRTDGGMSYVPIYLMPFISWKRGTS